MVSLVNYREIQKSLADSLAANPLQLVVDAPFMQKYAMVNLGIGIMVLLIKGNKSNLIHRVTLSNTDQAKGALNMTSMKFEEIKIPATDRQNIISKAIAERAPTSTTDWKYLFTPAIPAKFARFNQAGAGIGCSHVYPLDLGDGTGALIFSYFVTQNEIKDEAKDFMVQYSQLASDYLRLHHDAPEPYINA